MKNLLFLLTVLLTVVEVKAQSMSDSTCTMPSCSCSDFVVPAGVMIGRVHDKGEWMISYRRMSMNMQGVQVGTTEVQSTAVFNKYLMSPSTMRMDMNMLMVMYGASDRLTLMAMGNYNVNTMSMDVFSSSSHHHNEDGIESSDGKHHMNSKGIGDTKVYAQYGAIKKMGAQLAVNLGVNLPTGSINILGAPGDIMYSRTRLPYMMQLGSGTVDILPGVGWFHKIGNLSYAAQLNATVRTGKSKYDYRLGNDFNTNLWASYTLFSLVSPYLRMESLQSGLMTGADKALYTFNEPGTDPSNTGATRFMLYGGIQLKSDFEQKMGFNVSLEYGAPVYENVTGVQMQSKRTLNAAVTASF